MRLLEELERLSILALPARQGPGRGRQGPLSPGERSAPQAPLDCYHPLGYRQPIGCHLRYFLEDRQQRLLGCLLYDFAARYLPVRDRWIGWQGQAPPPPPRLPGRAARAGRPAPPPPAAGADCAASPFFAVSLGPREMLGLGALGLSLRQLAADWLAADPCSAARAGRNVCQRPAQGNLLPRLELALPGTDPGKFKVRYGDRVRRVGKAF